VTTLSLFGTVPSAIILDASGDLFVALTDSNLVAVYPPPYAAASTNIVSGIAAPVALAVDGNANLYVAGNSIVTAYAPPYTAAPATYLGVNQPNALAVGTYGLFVVNRNNSVTQYSLPDPGGNPTNTITSGLNFPVAIAINAANDVFVANALGNNVTVYAPPYTGPPIVTIANGINDPLSLVLDKSGNLFVANHPNTVTEYAPPYTGAPVATITNGVVDPVSLATFP
jgi:hypothetical protein